MCSHLSPTSVPATHGLDSARFFRLERLFRLWLSALWRSTSRRSRWHQRRFGGGGGDRNVSVEIESGSGGNMGEFEKRKAASRIQHAFDKVCFEY
ncbi:hypothetical protein HanPI659440_Chr12g0454481 [Helianthus annuus]|nr:hypothetical protein HanPI659440_Chr12g0454481 [Helianthus annuus]